MRVLVIGAGLSGLTTAYCLARAGIDVTVIEKEKYVGGRVKSGSYGGLSWECGAQFIGAMYPQTNDLLDKTGLQQGITPIKMRVDVISGQARYPLCRYSPFCLYPRFSTLSWLKRTALVKLGLFLWSHRARLNISNLADGETLDDISFGEWAESFLGPELVRQYFDPVSMALFFQPARHISRLVPLTLIRAPYKCRINSLRGGLSQLPMALAKAVKVMKNTSASMVELSPNGIAVEAALPEGNKTTLSADRVVFAVPPQVALSLLADPVGAIGRDSCDFLNTAHFIGVSVTCLVLSSPLVKGLYGYIFGPGEAGLTSISFGQNTETAPNRPTSATIISAGEKSSSGVLAGVPTNNANSPDLLKLAEHYVPGLSQRVVERGDYYWRHALPCFPPGRVREIGNYLSKKKPSIISFCGDYLGGPGIEGAITSGIRAAGEVISSLIT